MGFFSLPSTQFDYVATNPNEAWSIYGNNLGNQLVGGNLDDYIDGGNGSDTIDGGAGNDFINGGNDADTLYGWTGNDNLLGGAGDDWLYGEAGNDTLNGGASGFRDVLQGGSGDDVYIHYYNDGGLSWIADASGTSDKLVINDVTFGDLLFALDSSNNNNLIIYTAADDANGISDGIVIQNFFNGSGHGSGEVEYIQVGSTTYDFWDYLGLA
ncbi:Ca2+-binding RTX toxin-like protein [Azospirillum agricola]|uniref:calcium-binding protein n=1 Tax=Azospirillum agricola TaxID=1720247 RepID=UPI001AEB0632|nr:calcium-binding protein [Azospirillum agricola]MBP2230050.1 Ca2+-binding RTX toxin-like protein [Azospirillum agricola]